MNKFKKLISKKVVRLFLVVWTPWGEEKYSDIDMSFAFVFKDEPNKLCIISVDKNELWSPYITYESLPQIAFTWNDFYPRMKMWMKAEDEKLIIKKEYYEFTGSEVFKNILDANIEGLELISLEGTKESLGVRIHFMDDYIISVPNSDGNTVETKVFNRNGSIENFKHLGNVIYIKL